MDVRLLLIEIAENRARNVAYYEDAMASVADAATRDQLASQRDQEWHNEESQRATASIILRDCRAHVKSKF